MLLHLCIDIDIDFEDISQPFIFRQPHFLQRLAYVHICLRWTSTYFSDCVSSRLSKLSGPDPAARGRRRQSSNIFRHCEL